MDLRAGQRRLVLPPLRAACGEFGQQMLPLQLDLALGDRDRCEARSVPGALSDAARVEAVAAGGGVLGEGLEVRADGGERLRMRPEPLELRVCAIAWVRPARTAWASSDSRQHPVRPWRSR